MKKKLKLGIALSGGGRRVLLILGVLKALEEYDLKPDIISGVVPVLLWVFYTLMEKVSEEIMDFFKNLFFNFAINLPKLGDYKSNKI